METKLIRRIIKNNISIRETWKLPDRGTEIWCTAWKRGQTIIPIGDGHRIVIGYSTYSCREYMTILTRLEAAGYKWGIVGVDPERSPAARKKATA